MNNSNMQAGAPALKKNNTPIIIAVVVVVILLCCCLIGVGGYIYSRYVVGKAVSGFNNQIATAMPGGSIPGGLPSGSVPTGGLGDDATRAEAWGSALASIIQSNPASCTAPDATNTTIEVTQQPDASGVWTERWTVACGGGATIPVDITFTPAGGGLFTVKAAVGK
ncbi:MAG TPA: hypothetical protein VIN60_09360 [Anaerolineales bacterium]